MRTSIKKRMSIMSIGIFAALLLVGTGVGFYMYAPSNMIALDINPSIELHTNRLNRVISINPVNEDAIRLMEGYHLDDRDLDTVIEDIVDRMIFNGYLTEGQENKILITSEDTNTSEELLSRVNSVIASYLQEKQMNVQLLQQNLVITEDEEEVAHANNISAGKMAVVEKLLENIDGITAEELASTSIKELIQFSIDQNISLEDLIESNQIDALSSATIKTETSVLAKDADVSKIDSVDGNKKVQIDAISSATIKAESNVLEKAAGILAIGKVVENRNVQVDAISSATVKTDAGISEKGEYADGKSEDNDDYYNEDNDNEDNDNEDNDNEDNDNEDNDNEDNDDEDYDIEDKEDQDDSDEQDRKDVIGYRDESDSDDSEEGEYSYSREEDNDDEDNDDEDNDDDGDDEDDDDDGDED
ncbi:MAG: anti-sigma-I factor RsgI family protein [Mobilitalea sp.]